ncbi:MAG: NADPH-dependent F420 reductase [Solirubrobacterales bacterium]
MRIGVIGAGRIGGNAARLLATAGHEVMLSFSRDPDRLRADAETIGERASVGEVADAARFGDVVIFSVPWRLIGDVLEHAGSLEGKVVIDTTNQYGSGGLEELPDLTAAQVNQRRMPGALLVKAFNTLTSAFQASAAGREGDRRVVIFMAGDDDDAKATVAGLIEDAGFAPADVGGLADAAVMEAPRREGAVYGEEYRQADAAEVVEAVRADRPIPPTPEYDD